MQKKWIFLGIGIVLFWSLPVNAAPVDCNSGFVLTFEDIESSMGDGFDDPDEGVDRVNTACAVTSYLTDVIEFNGAHPEIYFDRSETATIGNGALAFASEFYPSFSLGQGGIGSYLQGAAVTGNSPSGYAATIHVDFGGRQAGGNIIPYHSAYPDSSAGNIDLFSVLLHEFTHALGFFSLIEPDGQSSVGGDFSLWDQLLWVNDELEMPLLDADFNFQADPLDLISNEVVYSSQAQESVAVFSPNPFSGSSLSHFDDVRDNFPFIMRPAYGGGDYRELSDIEKHVLCTQGYTLKGGFCENGYPVGIDDGEGGMFITGPGSQICMDVTANDTDPDGDPIFIDPSNIQLLNGGGSWEIINAGTDSEQLCYTPSDIFSGQALLTYRPTDLNQTGNVTRIEVGVTNPTSTCLDDPGNYVCNGGFELGVAANTPLDNNSLTCGNSMVDQWCEVLGTADLFIRDALSSNANSYDVVNNFMADGVDTVGGAGSGNDRYVGMILRALYPYMEGVKTQLVQPLLPNQQYILSFDAYSVKLPAYSSLPTEPSMLRVMLASQDGITETPLPAGISLDNTQDLGAFSVEVDVGWQHFEHPFEVDAVVNYLSMFGDRELQAGSNYVYLDNVSIRIPGATPPEILDNAFPVTMEVSDVQAYPLEEVYVNVKICSQNNAPEPIRAEVQLDAGWLVVSSSSMPDFPYINLPDGLAAGGCAARPFTIKILSLNASAPLPLCAGVTDYNNGEVFSSNPVCKEVFPRNVDQMLTLTTDNPEPEDGDEVNFLLTLSSVNLHKVKSTDVRFVLPANMELMEFIPRETLPGWFDGELLNANTIRFYELPGLTSEIFRQGTLRTIFHHESCGIQTVTAEITRQRFLKFSPSGAPFGMDLFDTNHENNEDSVQIRSSACAFAEPFFTKEVISETMPPQSGQSFMYRIVIKNDTERDFLELTLEDWLPAGLHFNSDDVTVSFSSDVEWVNLTTEDQNLPPDVSGFVKIETGAVPVGAEIKIIIPVTLKKELCGIKLSNTARLTSINGVSYDDPEYGFNFIATSGFALAECPETDLGINKELTEVSRISPVMGYTITVTNSGNVAAEAVEVTDILPANTKFVSANPAQGTAAYDSSTHQVVWAVGTLEAGETQTLLLYVKRLDQAAVLNRVKITAFEGNDPDLSNNTDTHTFGQRIEIKGEYKGYKARLLK